MTNKKAFIISTCSIFAVLITILIITAVNNGAVDLAISKSLVTLDLGQRYSKNFFGCLVETTAEIPMYLFAAVAAQCFDYIIKDSKIKKALKNTIRIILAVIAVGFCVYMYQRIIKYIYTCSHGYSDEVWCSLFGIELVISVPLALITAYLCHIAIIKIAPEKLALRRVCTIFVCASVCILALYFGTRDLVHRNRYRAIMALGNGDFDQYFTPWFKHGIKSLQAAPGALKADFQSFPSGHTSQACSTLVLMLLPSYFAKMNNKKWKLICYIAPACWIIYTMLGRVIMGAHYLSDVTMGAFNATLCFLVASIVEQLIYSKKQVKEEA